MKKSILQAIPFLAKYNLAIIVGILAVALGFSGYQLLFSSFAFYDDEGYVMLSLRSYMSGYALYDETYTQYGPAYYIVHSVVHSILGLPITHDIIRFKTLAQWFILSGMGMWYVLRMTRSKTCAIVSFALIFFHLDRFAMEPGHPVEFCALGVIFILLLSTFVQSAKRPAWIIVGIGFFVAMVAMTKLNLGGFLLLSISLAIVLFAPHSRLRTTTAFLFTFFAALLPFAIAKQFVFSLAGIQLPGVVVVGIAATVLVSMKADFVPFFKLSHLLVFWGSFVVGCGAFAGLAIVNGTTFLSLADGLILQHLPFMAKQYRHPPLYFPAVFFALAVGIAAVMFVRKKRDHTRLIRLVVIAIAVGLGVRYLTDVFTPLTHGGMDRGHAVLLVGFVVPIAWILLTPYFLRSPNELEPSLVGQQFSRVFLCLISVLQTLGAYPIPGTQMALGSLGLLFVVLICIWDHLQIERLLGKTELLLRRGPVVVLMVFALLATLSRDLFLWQSRMSYSPLNLPGSRYLRLPDEEVKRIRWTVSKLKDDADTFLCLPMGNCSLYFWTELPPPTLLNTTDWPALLTDQQQEYVISELATYDRVYVVFDKRRVPAREDAPLVRHLRTNYEVLEEFEEIQIWKRISKSDNSQ